MFAFFCLLAQKLFFESLHFSFFSLMILSDKENFLNNYYAR